MSEDGITDDRSTGETPSIKGVETTLRIVDTLKTIGPATLSEVARDVEMSKGGAYKQLKTLSRGGYVIQEDKQYRLSFRFLDIGGRLRDDYPGAGLIKMKIQELAVETGETGIFTVLDGDRTFTLFRETGEHGLSTRTRIGQQRYPHTTAAGKCILAQMPAEAVEAIFEGNTLPKVTKHTITDMDVFMEELAEVRERGYAYNRGENVAGLVAVAAPLVADGRVLGACSVTGARHRLEGDPVTDEIRSTLLSFVRELEHNIARSQLA